MAQHRGRVPGTGSGRLAYRQDDRPLAGRPTGQPNALRGRLREVVAPVVAGAGYDLEEVSVSRVGRRHLVRIVVDADGGVSLDAVADLSRVISTALDAAEETGGELLAGEYQLEVSSPGVDRPLTHPRHWRRNLGRLVKVTAAGRQLTGRILSADDDRVRLGVDGTVQEVGHDTLGPGRVQVEFERPGDLAEAGFAEDDLDEIEEEEGVDEE